MAVEINHSCWVEIPVARGITVVGRSRSCAVCLAHNCVSREHLRLEFDGSQLCLTDLGSRCGTFVNGHRVSQCVIKPGDFIRIGVSPPYHWVGDSIRPMPEAIGLRVELRDIGVVRDGRPLMAHASATVGAGQFVGLLGPSGAGKSLMLGCLSSSLLPSMGELLFDDGENIHDHLDYYRSRIGVVTQDDLVYDELTVTENLDLAARIRLAHANSGERRTAVADSAEKVGLTQHSNKRAVVLSGGQRKRLSVGIELLSHPRLLLLDEPTSGLDPGMQARVMETLRFLSRQGISVVCSTHTMDTLNFFDSVIVLGLVNHCATVVYCGTPQRLLPAFKVGNVADLFERLAELPAAGGIPREAGFNSGPSGEPDAAVGAFPRSIEPHRAKSQRSTGFLMQAAVVWWRAILGLFRDLGSFLFALVQPPIFAVLIAFSQPAYAPSSYVHFFSVMAALWLGMTVTVREIVRERKLYARDRLAGLKPSAYLGGKLLFALSITAVQAALLYTGIRFFATSWVDSFSAKGIHDVPAMLGYCLLVAVEFGGCILGFILSTLAKTERTAVALLPLILLPQVVLSRVTYGDGDKPWSYPSPYCPIALTLRSYRKAYRVEHPNHAKHKGSKLLLSLGSLPMLTRPGTAALDMLAEAKISQRRRGWIFWEDVYLLSLLALHGLGFVTVFYWRERSWLNTRG